MKVNKEKVKSVVKKAVVLIAASLATISIFACGGKIETKMEYPSISIDQDVNTGNDSKVKVTEEVVKPTEIKETKKYIEETTKPIETTEQITPDHSLEELQAELQKLKEKAEIKTGTDAKGRPYLQKGQEYTWSASGEPNEAPYNGKDGKTVKSPVDGKTYTYFADEARWYGEDKEAEKERNRLIMEEDYVTDSNGNLVKGRKLTEEEARQIAKMFSDSFK